MNKKTLNTLTNLILALIFLISLISFIYLSFFDKPKKESNIRTTSIEMTSLNAVNNFPVSISSLKEKVVLINFWATWCGPCIYEIPELITLKNKFKHADFEIIGISMDDSTSTVLSFMRSTPINYPVIMASNETNKLFGDVFAIPTTLIYDKGLTYVSKIQGFQDQTTLASIVSELLNNDQ